MNFLTLIILVNGDPLELTMPSATTGAYAAMRVAEELGQDPLSRRWCLVYENEEGVQVTVPDSEIIDRYASRQLHLGVKRKR